MWYSAPPIALHLPVFIIFMMNQRVATLFFQPQNVCRTSSSIFVGQKDKKQSEEELCLVKCFRIVCSACVIHCVYVKDVAYKGMNKYYLTFIG